MSPLTWAEATERSSRIRVRQATVGLDLRGLDLRSLDLHSLDLHSLDLRSAADGPRSAVGSRSKETFRSTTTIEFSDALPGAPTFVDFRPVTLLSAQLNGAPIDPGQLVDGRLEIVPAAENVLVLSGEMAYSSDGEGLHRHVDPADGQAYLYAMSFLDAGPRWFASFDQPDLKCPYVFGVQAPAEWTVLGNARFRQVAAGEWESTRTPPLASYFVTLVAGPYVSVRDEHDGIRLGLHTRASLADELRAEAADLFEVTKQGFDALHARFGQRYAFGDYHQVFVPDFNAGAMENPGCVTFRDSYLFRGQATWAERAARAGTVVHELTHQWFGDLVTMRWWDDLWLNESFAEYLGHVVCTEHTRYPLWVDFGLNRKDWGSIADQGSNTHPVAGNGAADTAEALSQFDGISYAKGAGVLKQLVAHIGVDVFTAGLRDYFQRHRFGNATFADLRAALERAGAADLGDWSEAWLHSAGMDTLTVVSEPDGARVMRTPGGPGRREHTLQVAAYAADGAELVRRAGTVGPAGPRDAGAGEEGEAGDWPIDALPPSALLVPDAADETWARIRPDRPVGQWPAISQIAEPLTRVVLWNSVRDQVRSAELDPAIALDVLCEQLPEESEDLIVRVLLDWGLAVLAGPYAQPADRPARRRRLAGLAETMLAAAPAGSDRQLLAWRAVLGATDDVAALRGWLDGVDLPRELDPELRWRATTRLASLTGDREAVERAYALDHSAAGRVHRARALAALPQQAAKQAAFDQLMQPTELSAYELYALADGLFLPEQDAVTADLVPRYFQAIGGVAAFRSGWALGQIVQRSFPHCANSPETLQRAEALLATEDLAPGLYRPLREVTDHLRRAVASIEKYG